MAYPFWLDVTLDAGKFRPPALGVDGKEGWAWGSGERKGVLLWLFTKALHEVLLRS